MDNHIKRENNEMELRMHAGDIVARQNVQTHIGLDKLTERQKQILKELVNDTCQHCGRQGTQPHRINRGYKGGKYTPNNIIMLCDRCHKTMHFGEFTK